MQISIIGCGNMGAALAQRLSVAHKIYFYDRNFDKAASLAAQGLGVAVHTQEEALKLSDIVILAVKPQNLGEAVQQLAPHLHSKHIFISLLAGTTCAQLKSCFPACTIIRMMPNLAVAQGEGLMALCTPDTLEPSPKDSITYMCSLLGKAYWIEESKMDGFTALAGSGPAFIFTILEAIVDAGIAMGIPAKDALDISQQMIKGSLAILEDTGKHPGQLKWQITSPAGTTIAGIRKLEQEGVRGAIIDTFLASYMRAKELTKS